MRLQELEARLVENLDGSPEQLQAIKDNLKKAVGNVSISKTEGAEAAIATFAKYISNMPKIQYDAVSKALIETIRQGREIADSAKLLSNKIAESAEKSAESAEKSAESIADKLSKRQKQIIDCMETGVLYSTEKIATVIGLKGPRTRQLLNELVAMGIVECTAATKNRKYVKK